MSKYETTNKIKILFDEYHSESWSISQEKAVGIQSDRPDNSSYSEAAKLLTEREFSVFRNHQKLSDESLKDYHVLVLLHPCDSKWESTTSTNSPKLDADEIKSVQSFVVNGGSLLIITEYENEKYGNNINELLENYNIVVNNDTVRQDDNSLKDNPTHVRLDFSQKNTFNINLNECYFLRCGSINTDNENKAITVSSNAKQKLACVVAKKEIDRGRVVVVTDSDAFGNEYINQFDHSLLWLNIFYWLSQNISKNFLNKSLTKESVLSNPVWLKIKSIVNELQKIQTRDKSDPKEILNGSINIDEVENAKKLNAELQQQIVELKNIFPHQTEYFEKLIIDLQNWEKSDFGEPDFVKSLNVIHLEKTRDDGTFNIAIFPIYTPNHSSDIKFEAIIYKSVFPVWLKQINDEQVENRMFVSANLLDYTNSYESECAVFFPEMVKVKEKREADNHFGVIFSNREAKRCQFYTQKAIDSLKVIAPPDVQFYLNSLDIIQESFALWDLIHDKSHFEGFMPFDPNIVRKKLPFWMYSLEELRVDLESYYKAINFEKEGFTYAKWVKLSIVFDRIFRFPIAIKKRQNGAIGDYDGVAGQLLCKFLFDEDILVFKGNILSVEWNSIDKAVLKLRDLLLNLYKVGLNTTDIQHWQNSHDFISGYLTPHQNSKWVKSRRIDIVDKEKKEWINLQLIDEFPLNNFYQHLKGLHN